MYIFTLNIVSSKRVIQQKVATISIYTNNQRSTIHRSLSNNKSNETNSTMWKWSSKESSSSPKNSTTAAGSTTTPTSSLVSSITSTIDNINNANNKDEAINILSESFSKFAQSSISNLSNNYNNNSNDDKRQEEDEDDNEAIEANELGTIPSISDVDKTDRSATIPSIATAGSTSDQSSSTKQSNSLEGVARMLGSLLTNNNNGTKDKNKSDLKESGNNLKEKEENQALNFLTQSSQNTQVSTSTPPIRSSISSSASISNTKPSAAASSDNSNLGMKLLQLMKIYATSSSGKNDSKREHLAIADIVAQVRANVEEADDYSANHNDLSDPNSIKEIMGIFNQYKDLMKKVADKYVGNIDFTKLTPTAIFYYLEREDEIKNPSWKRRQHRFCEGINIQEVRELYDACEFAKLSYADTVDEIRTALTNSKPHPYELVFAELRSATGQPASFVAVKNDPSAKKTNPKKHKLEVIIVVRGTKTAADAFTDLLCDSEPYQGGSAHSFIVTSGIYIADKHRRLLLDLLEKSGASKINLTLIGHSLGAGAASIAGMEFNNEKSTFYSPKIKARVVGFGCPALVSEELAKNSSSYITTVVNDSDVVPRMSGASVANMLHNVLEFDWRDYAKKDLESILQEFERKQPLLFRAGTGKAIQSIVNSLLEKYGKDLIGTTKAERLPIELFPPGKVLHFYHDGKGISASFVPNTFFNEIDVTRRMIDDHLFFSGYQGTFLAVVRQHKQDHHYRFEIDG